MYLSKSRSMRIAFVYLVLSICRAQNETVDLDHRTYIDHVPGTLECTSETGTMMVVSRALASRWQ